MTPQDHVRHAQRVLTAHALADADPAPLADLLGRCGERRLATGEPLFQEGDPAQEVFNLLEGTVKLYKSLPDGRTQITGFL